MVNADPIWILETDPASLSLYRQTLGLQNPLDIFLSFEDFSKAYQAAPAGQPRLLIADPELTNGALANFYRGFMNGHDRHFPETIIVTNDDSIDSLRFYYRAGIRDYLLKPLRPNELVAKVERALMQINNRSILILKNDLDGQQVPNLTFKEHQILTVLLNKPSRTEQRDVLLEAIWNKAIVNRKTLDVHVFNLRRKIRPMGYDILCKEQQLILQKLAPARSDV